MNMNTDHDRRSLIVSEVMTPDKANFAGNIHGGAIMRICDQASYACAARYASSYVVTLSVNQILFKHPIHVGELVTFFARVNYVGKTSLEVGIRVVAENLISRQQCHTNSCFFTMVAVDDNMRPIKVSPLTLDNPTDKRRYEEALIRKEMQQKYHQEHQKRKKELRDRLSQ